MNREEVESNSHCCIKTDKGLIIGNEVDIAMFRNSGFLMHYENDNCIVESPHSSRKLKLLKKYEFDRNSMTMSVLLEDVNTKERTVFCKGSYETIEKRFKQDAIPLHYKRVTVDVAKDGFYAIAMAFKPYTGPSDVSELSREEVETDLLPLGILLFKNELKADTEDVITELKEGAIRTVMITGDNVHTAIKISRECGLSTAPTIIICDLKEEKKQEEENFLEKQEVFLNEMKYKQMFEWVDADTQQKISNPLDFLNQLQMGHAEFAVTGRAFDVLHKLTNQTDHDEKNGVRQHSTYNNEYLPSASSLATITHTTNSKQGLINASEETASFPQSAASPSNSSCASLTHDSTFNPMKNKNEIKENSNYKTNKSNFFTENQLTRFTRIYARMKPEQKVMAVSNNMKLGVTGMCGDGANDAGALRMAHCGVAVAAANSDATIVAPFSATDKSLKAVINVLRYGRCGLASALSGYKTLIVYGQSLVGLSIIQYYLGIIASELFWLTWDGVVTVLMSWAIMQHYPAKRLSPNRPTSKLIGAETALSIACQVLLNWLCLVLGLALLFNESWFVCKEFDSNTVDQGKWWLKGDNYEAAVVGIIVLFQLMSCAFIFNFGFDYRRRWYRNYWLIGFFVIFFIYGSAILLTDPSGFSCLYRINCGDWSLLKRWGQLGKINKLYEQPSTVPTGCECNEQIDYSSTCESEYVDCKNDIFNQTYHHNIMPFYFRIYIFIIICSNIILGITFEKFLLVGPIRRYFRKRRNEKNISILINKKLIFSNNNAIMSEVEKEDNNKVEKYHCNNVCYNDTNGIII